MHFSTLAYIAILTGTLPPSSPEPPPTEAKIVVVGKMIAVSPTPQNRGGHVIGPVAPLARAFGAHDVTFESTDGTLSILGANGAEILLSAGSATLVRDGAPVALPEKYALVDGKMIGPIAPVLRALGAHCRWQSEEGVLVVDAGVERIAVHGDEEGVRIDVLAACPVPHRRGELDDPPRVYVDLLHARLDDPAGTTYVNQAGVARVRWAQPEDSPSTTRVVVDLKRPAPVSVTGSDGGRVATLSVGALHGDEPLIERPRPKLIAVHGGADGQGVTRVSAEFTDPVLYDFQVRRDPPEIVLKFRGVDIAEQARVVSLHSPFVSRAQPLQQEGDALVVLEMRQLIGFAVDQTDEPSRLTLSFRKGRLQDRLVVVDPGHGGEDPGAMGTMLEEKRINLAVGLRVSELLSEEGVYCVLTRQTDRFAGLFERPALANRLGADLFVSVHCNADEGAGEGQGTETWYYTDRSKALAAIMQCSLAERLGRPDRGVKRARFVVVRESRMPACLVELAFINNVEEEALLAAPLFQERAARAIAAGLRTYVEGTGLIPTVEGQLGG